MSHSSIQYECDEASSARDNRSKQARHPLRLKTNPYPRFRRLLHLHGHHGLGGLPLQPGNATHERRWILPHLLVLRVRSSPSRRTQVRFIYWCCCYLSDRSLTLKFWPCIWLHGVHYKQWMWMSLAFTSTCVKLQYNCSIQRGFLKWQQTSCFNLEYVFFYF